MSRIDIGLLYVSAGKRIGSVPVQAEAVHAGHVPNHLAGRAAHAGVDAGGNNAQLAARMRQVFPDILLHVAVQIGAARDVSLAGDEDRKLFTEYGHEPEHTDSDGATQLSGHFFCATFRGIMSSIGYSDVLSNGGV